MIDDQPAEINSDATGKTWRSSPQLSTTREWTLAIVWDNASWHTAKDLTKLFKPGQIFDNITIIRMPPYAPDHNPVEHVWNQGKGAIANIQRDTPTHTFSAFEEYIRSRRFKYDFEHLATPGTQM